MVEKRKNIIKEKTFNFALQIIKICDYLNANNEFVLSRQLLRSGTSIGAMIRESENAESKKDFIHKLSIAQKETNETMYWLELLIASNKILKEEISYIKNEADQIMKILTSIIISSKNSL